MTKTAETALTKGRFIEGLPCPTRLVYRRQRDLFGTTTDDDPFLAQLAEGGFQVGALAQLQWPGGVTVDTLDFAEAERHTRRLLGRPEVVIFEAAVRLGDAIARIDILAKKGRRLALIEVKAKSFGGSRGEFWRPERKGNVAELREEWLPKLSDVAFQTLLCRGAWPHLDTTPFLMVADKRARATVDGLHQKFRLQENVRGRTRVDLAGDVSPAALGAPLLTQVDVSDEVDALIAGTASAAHGPLGEEIEDLAGIFVHGKNVFSPVGKKCRKCPCRIAVGADERGLASGFEACWHRALGAPVAELRARPLVLDVPRLPRHAQLLAEGEVFLADLAREQVYPAERGKGAAKAGMDLHDRHWKRIEKLRAGDTSPYFDRAGLRAVMATWTFPLHFIDFETMTAAIPFHRGLRPYETLAFQFSHHVLEEDGSVVHQSQWLEARAGVFPNFDFVRSLRAALGTHGTIFRFADHENSVLCHILRQLDELQPAPADKEELAAWIKTVTHGPARPKKGEASWRGSRDLQDLKDIAQRFVLMPAAGGSNSLKALLPACMSSSSALRGKYSRPIYGARGGIPSHNFRDKVWWRAAPAGGAEDPYALLAEEATLGRSAGGGAGPRPRAPAPEDDHDANGVAHGSEAMRAYERLQYTDLDDDGRAALVEALARYCELDTLAMVMLVESWRAEVGLAR